MIKIIALLFLFGVFQFSNGNPTNDDRIVNGEDAELGQFPHQVLWTLTGNVMCGGSIYNKSTIITAAHCCKPFEDGEQLHDQLGLTDIVAGRLVFDDFVNGQDIPIKSYLIHPDYIGVSEDGSGSHANDICLLTLESDLEFNENVKAIALNNGTVDAGTKCIVSGWGTLTVSSSVSSNQGMIDIVMTNIFYIQLIFFKFDNLEIFSHFSYLFLYSRVAVLPLIYFMYTSII